MASLRRALLVPGAIWLVILAAGLALDLWTTEYTQLIMLYILVNTVLALSLNLVNGFTGQFSLGHAGFMAVGAYTSAYLSMPDLAGWKPFAGQLEILNFPLYAVCAGLVTAVAGFLVGLPSLRLRGDYLAIVTLGFSEIIRVSLLNMNVIGGARGLPAIPGLPFMQSFAVASFCALTCLIVHWRLVRSKHGRAFMSVREDEVAAEAMGVDTTRAKVSAFVISSFFAGVAGSLFAHSAHYLNPSTFGFNKAVDVIIMVVLGGMGSLSGSVLAAVVVTVLPEMVLRPLQEYTHVDLRMVIYSLTLILFMVLRPKGLFGHLEITEIWQQWRARAAAAGGGIRNGAGRGANA